MNPIACRLLLGWLALLWLILPPVWLRAAEFPSIPRVLPAPATALPDAAVTEPLLAETKAVAERLAALRRKEPGLAADVEVFFKAARFALEIGEFWNPKDIEKVRALLDEGRRRLEALEKGAKHADWTRQKGLVVRGFYSEIDGSAQPYGLEIPEGLELPDPARTRTGDAVPPLWIWLHGRGDKETDLHFIAGRMSRKGQFQPADAIVVHPLGRQCIGWKGPGETDALECCEAASRALYGSEGRPRFVLMGFSMGGAGSWQLAAHHPWKWSVVHAGAGFVDVARFTSMPKDQYPADFVQTLWGVSNVPLYVRNLFNMPVIAYSGEVDKQRDAAEYMSEAFQGEGQKLRHLIGPQMPHKYDPESIKLVTEFIQRALRGEESAANAPGHVTFQTRTLRYHRAPHLVLNGLEEHWLDSRVDLQLTGSAGAQVQTRNVSDLTLSEVGAKVSIDGASIANPQPRGELRLVKSGGTWQAVPRDQAPSGLRKIPGLQGPVDDAFMEPFLVVLPEGPSNHPAVEQWVQFEMNHFLRRWREVFRGEARVKKASEVTPEDASRYHLVCWGDATSNAIIRKTLPKLPLRWDAAQAAVGEKSVSAETHVPILVYPNPLHPSRYLVINSGPTFRENDDRNNSQQNPKLPDWALIDVTVPPDDKTPGGVSAAGFFDEEWKVKTR
jgi:pimeloyl-ACP methyl ester carboxylesterase